MNANEMTELIKYPVTDNAIADIKERFLALRVASLEDHDGYKQCDTARKEVKGLRVKVEKRRQELKADSLEFGRMVDGEARRITTQLEQVERHLIIQQKIVDDEIERLEREKERLEAEKFRARVDALQEVGGRWDLEAIRIMGDDEFEAMIADLQLARKSKLEAEAAEKKRVAELEAEREVQAKKLREEQAAREEQERIAAKARDDAEAAERRAKEAEQARIKAEQDKAESESRRIAEAELASKRAAQAAEDAEKRRIAEATAAEERRLADIAAEKKLAADAEQARQQQKTKAEEEKRQKLEAAKANKQKVQAALARVREEFPTLELAWTQIVRLESQLNCLGLEVEQ